MEPTTNYAGEEVFVVAIVYEGTEHTVDANKSIKVLPVLATPLEELGLPPVLLQGFVPKDEYPMLLALRAESAYDEEE